MSNTENNKLFQKKLNYLPESGFAFSEKCLSEKSLWVDLNRESKINAVVDNNDMNSPIEYSKYRVHVSTGLIVIKSQGSVISIYNISRTCANLLIER